MFDRVSTDITALEQNMAKAEEDLGYNNTGIKGFFKPLLGKIVKNDRNRPESVDETAPTHTPIDLFKSSDYFGEIGPNDLEEKEGTSKAD